MFELGLNKLTMSDMKARIRFSFRPAERFRQREDLAVLQPFGGSQEDGLESLSYPNGILVDKHDVIVN